MKLPLLDGLDDFWHGQKTFAMSVVSTRHSYFSSQRLGC